MKQLPGYHSAVRYQQRSVYAEYLLPVTQTLIQWKAAGISIAAIIFCCLLMMQDAIAATRFNPSVADSLLPMVMPARQNPNADSLMQTDGVDEVATLNGIEDALAHQFASNKSMIRLLKKLRLKRAFTSKRFQRRMYNNMATIAARLKWYPLAMNYHLQSLQLLQDSLEGHWINSPAVVEADSTTLINDEAIITFIDQHASTKQKHLQSLPTTAQQIAALFDDAESAAAYAVLLHVKQPKPGSRKAFTGIDNVGHMFVTLIQYNADQSFTHYSFGLYPYKTNFFSATPLHPAAVAMFRNDAAHDCDVAIGKFISYRRFKKVIRLLQKFEGKTYHLNENNCTDFGLSIAALSGLDITATAGKWPLGKGNNPANAGQSLLEQRYTDEAHPAGEEIFFFHP